MIPDGFVMVLGLSCVLSMTSGGSPWLFKVLFDEISAQHEAQAMRNSCGWCCCNDDDDDMVAENI